MTGPIAGFVLRLGAGCLRLRLRRGHHGRMGGNIRSEAVRGEMFLDARGDGRAMRLSWHPEADIVVLSLWREGTCAGTFRMPHADVSEFIDALVDGLRDAPGVHLPPRTATRESASMPAASADDGASDDVAQTSRLAFTDWAFGPPSPDSHATAS